MGDHLLGDSLDLLPEFRHAGGSLQGAASLPIVGWYNLRDGVDLDLLGHEERPRPRLGEVVVGPLPLSEL